MIATAASCCGLAQSVTLSLSSTSAAPGATVTLNVSLASTGNQPASVQWDLGFSTTDFSSVTVAAAPGAGNKTLSCEYGAGTAMCLLWGLNDSTIANGVIATLNLTVSASTLSTTSLVQLINGTSASITSTPLSTFTSNGTVTISKGPSLNGFSCNPTAVSPTVGATCTVALTSAAGSGGATINLTSSPVDANIPSTVTVPEGSTSVTFPVSAGSVTTPTPVTLTASFAGSTETFGLTVNPASAALSGISVSPGAIIGGQSAGGSVSLTAPAPAGGAVVTLSSSNSSAASVPGSVTVPQGSTVATFTVTSGSVNTSTPVTLTAKYSGVTMTFGLTVNALPDFSLSASPTEASVAAGGSAAYTVTVTGGNGFSGTVNFGMSGLPSGVTGSFNPTTVTGSGSTTLTILTTSGASLGGITITVTGTSGSLNHNTTASLTITGGSSSGPPAPVSVTPNTGSGSSQTFAFSFSDPNGATDITTAQIDISSTLSVSGACYVYYPRGLNELYLASDAGVWQGPLPLGVTGTLQNSQCILNVGASSASMSGNTLTLNLALSFTAAFAGAKNVYMEVENATHDSGWSMHGTWTVGSAAPAPDFSIGMTAGPGSVAAGGSAAYTVTVTGNNGFNGTVSFGTPGLPSGVTGSFNPTTVTGSGSTTLTITTTGGASAGGITITVAGASGSLNHNTSASLTITGASSGGYPAAVSVSPNSGSGASQTFTFTYSDPNGAADITSAQIDISATLSVSGACYLYYPRGLNEMYLASDTGVWQGPLPIGNAGTLQNSQCTLNVGASSASTSGNTLTLNLALSFTAAFAGAKNVYMEVENATHDSGWSQFGSWTVASGVQSASPPTPVSVTPNTGSGLSQTFAFVFTDGNGAADITTAQIDISATLAVSGACYLYYPRGLNELYLASDTGVWQGPLPIGSAGTLQNSQCTLNVGASSASMSGNTLTLNLALSFTAAFAGAKNVYMEVENATHDSGWSPHGAWTVP